MIPYLEHRLTGIIQPDTVSISGRTNMISLCNKLLQDIHSLNLNHLPWDIKIFQQGMSVHA
jgi:hypothetical protein